MKIRLEEKTKDSESAKQDREALEFFEKNRAFYENNYARGQVKIKQGSPSFNLVTDEISLDSNFYKDKNFSAEKVSYATCHEIEHFLEKKQLLNEPGGEKIFAEYLKNKQSKAWGILDNCIADIRENKAVNQKTNVGFRATEHDMYTNDLFPTNDFTDAPMHIQFSQAILRESRVQGEPCVVAPEVRAKLDEFYNIAPQGSKGKPKELLDAMTNPATPMSLRLELQEEYVVPMMNELLQKDLENNQDNSKDEPCGEDGESKEGNEGEKENKQKPSEQNSGKEGKDKKSEGKEGEKGKQTSPQKGSGEGEKGKKLDPNEVFKDAYEKAKKSILNEMPPEADKKALKDFKEFKKQQSPEYADAEYAKKIGVKPEDLRAYRSIVEKIKDIKNPETNRPVVEELQHLFARIIARRLKPQQFPKYPVDEGDHLIDPVGAITEAHRGNFEPKVWESQEIKERKGQKFGEIEITLVCDRSRSMEGEKLREQQKSAVFLMEALKEFNDLADAERVNMDKPLEIRTEIYTFQSSAVDATPIKKMSKELGETDRVRVAGVLSSAPGSTTDFVCLESIDTAISRETLEKLRDGELKKIIIVFTDGGSDNKSRVATVLQSLRSKGIVAIGVGITASGKPALETYAPNAELANQAVDLPIVLGKLLKEHLNV